MTYHELFKYIKERFINADVSGFKSDVSYQFNVRGEGEGAFYAEVKNKVLSIEPYEYYNRDVIFEADSKVLLDIADGKLDPTQAYLAGKLKFSGDTEKAMEFKKLLKTKTSVKEKKEKIEKAVSSAKETVKETAKETAEKVEKVVSDVKGSVKETVKETAEKVEKAVENKKTSVSSNRRGKKRNSK